MARARGGAHPRSLIVVARVDRSVEPVHSGMQRLPWIHTRACCFVVFLLPGVWTWVCNSPGEARHAFVQVWLHTIAWNDFGVSSMSAGWCPMLAKFDQVRSDLAWARIRRSDFGPRFPILLPALVGTKASLE